MAEEGNEPQPGARGSRDVAPVLVELGTRADVHVVVAHALVDVATVLGLGGDLGVDALLEPEGKHRQDLLGSQSLHRSREALRELRSARQTLRVRAHLTQRLEATAEDRTRRGTEALECRRDDGQRHGPRRAVPEPERRLQRGGYSDDRGRPRRRGLTRCSRRRHRLDPLPHHVGVNALGDEGCEAGARLHRHPLVHRVQHLHQFVAR